MSVLVLARAQIQKHVTEECVPVPRLGLTRFPYGVEFGVVVPGDAADGFVPRDGDEFDPEEVFVDVEDGGDDFRDGEVLLDEVVI